MTTPTQKGERLPCQFCGGDLAEGAPGHNSGCPTGHGPRAAQKGEREEALEVVERLRDASLEDAQASWDNSPQRWAVRSTLLSNAADTIERLLSSSKAEGEMREGKVFSESDRCEACGYMRWHGDNCPRCESRLTPRPKTSDADEWQLWLQDGLQSEPATGIAFLAVQIVEAIEEHQKALAREVYALAEGAAERFGDVAAEDTPEGHYCRGAIHEAKSIAKAINAIMPYSRDPAALSPKESA